ncbi:MAG: nucleotide exchange factor GrpE [Alphaproteobacteria bacterium]
MTQTEHDEKSPNGAPQTPANDPGPEAAPAEPGADSGMPRAELEARFAALAAELAEKSAEFAAFKDSAQRQLAEKENQRRRAENEMADARKYGAVPFARDTLALADNLRRALAAAAAPADDQAARAQLFDALRQGVELIDREFAGILERHGIKRIEPLGEKFDPNWHQAMFEADVPGAAPGSVIQVVQPGYRLHDRLLRAAMVGVAKAKAAAAAEDAPQGEAPPS